MTTISDFTIVAAPQQTKILIDGRPIVVRSAQRLIGFALLLAVAGLWFLPGASWDADTAVMKLTLSMFFGFSGLIIMNLSSTRS